MNLGGNRVFCLDSYKITSLGRDSRYMVNSKSQTIPLKAIHRSWVIYGSSKREISKIQRGVDSILSGYSFYPEVDWGQYGYRPPDGHQIMGAWRHPETKAFAFLLDNPNIRAVEPSIQLLLQIAGENVEISQLEPKIEALKTELHIEEQKDRVDTYLGERLDRIRKSKSLAPLTGVLCLFTAIINAFSLYLRKLPPPELGWQEFIEIYRVFLGVIHLGALLLLLLVIAIVAGFLIKYGMLLIRRV